MISDKLCFKIDGAGAVAARGCTDVSYCIAAITSRTFRPYKEVDAGEEQCLPGRTDCYAEPVLPAGLRISVKRGSKGCCIKNVKQEKYNILYPKR